jgi:hypothetical protein
MSAWSPPDARHAAIAAGNAHLSPGHHVDGGSRAEILVARTATLNDFEAEKRTAAFIAELEQKLRKMDDSGRLSWRHLLPPPQ